jgi:uncharacterized FlaG/YvyC family protein
MLTRDDLEQIRGVVKEEVRETIREEVRGIVREEVTLQVKPVNRKLNRIQKEITFVVHDYSNAISGLRKRVERIEDHLDLPQV